MIKDWTNFRKASPLHHGNYTWKVSDHNGFDHVFVAYFGPKFYGNDQPYPYFVRWNGWFGELPRGRVLWRDRLEDESEPDKQYNYELLWIEKDNERIELKPCPFCKRIPQFMGTQGFIGAFPHQYPKWSLKCCHTVNWTSLTGTTPLTVADNWNLKLS